MVEEKMTVTSRRSPVRCYINIHLRVTRPSNSGDSPTLSLVNQMFLCPFGMITKMVAKSVLNIINIISVISSSLSLIVKNVGDHEIAPTTSHGEGNVILKAGHGFANGSVGDSRERHTEIEPGVLGLKR